MPAPALHLPIVTVAQLRAEGCSQDSAERRVRAGRWQRPARGIYVRHDTALTSAELGQAAAAVAGSAVVVSGLLSLRELELRWLPDADDVLALVPPDVRTPSNGRIVLRRTTGFHSLETWTRSGVTYAMAPRAVVDAARGLDDLRDVRGVVLGAVADGWAGVDDLRTHLDTTQRNGSGLARRAILDAERGCASPPEAEVVDHLVGCGLPFYVNPHLHLHGRLLGSPDIWFLGRGIGGEVDSQERHGSDEDTESTYDRHERITATGLELVHLSVRRIRQDPRAAADHLVRRALDRGAGQPAEPSGLIVVPRGLLLR